MEKAEKLSSSSSNEMAVESWVECANSSKEPHVTKRQRASEGSGIEGASNEEKCGFPSKKRHLEKSENAVELSRVYQFKVTLKRSKPPIWRRIQVPGNYNFWELHVAIQLAMGWQGYHLHRFQMLPKNSHPDIGLPSDESSESEEESDEESDNFFSWFGPSKTLSGKKVDIADLFTSPGDKANYEYDFGDGWDHTILLEKILPAIAGTSYPLCITGKRACPPEDCGGIWGYEDMLKIISNPRHEEYKERMEHLGGHFDPVKFDPKAVVFLNTKILVA